MTNINKLPIVDVKDSGKIVATQDGESVRYRYSDIKEDILGDQDSLQDQLNERVQYFLTLSSALQTDIPIGRVVVTAGTNTSEDQKGQHYLVVAAGSGGESMQNGNELLPTDFGITPLDSVQNIAGFQGAYDGQQASVAGWHPDSTVGGGILVWNPTRAKPDHNGGTVFSPTVPWTTTTADYLNGVGETDPAGFGVWESLETHSVSLYEFGAVSNDSLVDNSQSLINALISNAYSLTGNGETYYIANFVSVTLPVKRKLKDIKLIYNGAADQQNMIRMRINNDLEMINVEADAVTLCSKVIYVNPNSESCNVLARDCKGINGLQTDIATGFSGGLVVLPESGVGTFFNSCTVIGGEYSNCTSTKAYTGLLTSVGRGVYVSDCKYTKATGITINDIGPYQDGDGFVVTADNGIAGRRELFEFSIDQCTFTDCEKRAIKSQVGKTEVGIVTVTRTQPFADGGGQCEVDCLEGGTVEKVVCNYSTGCQPVSVVNYTVSNNDFDGARMQLGAVVVKAESRNDVIRSIVTASLNIDSQLYELSFNNLQIGCKVRNFVRLYTANQVTDNTKFNRLLLDNASAEGFEGVTEDAVFFITRGSSSYNRSDVDIKNVSVRSGEIPALYYLDPAPGSTSFLSCSPKTVFNTPNIDGRRIDKIIGVSDSTVYVAAENAALTVTFDLSSAYSAPVITVSYTSARADAFNKLFTQGIIQSGSSRTYYNELIAGIKSSANCGAIAINEDAANNRFTVTKTAGSTSGTGYLVINISDIGNISSIT